MKKVTKREVLRWKLPTCQFLKEMFYNGTDSEPRFLQRYRFWTEIFTDDFELKCIHCFRFCRKPCVQEITFCFVVISINEKFLQILCVYKFDFAFEKFIVLGFDFKNHQCVRFWVEGFTTRQILYQKLQHDQNLKETLHSIIQLSTAMTP